MKKLNLVQKDNQLIIGGVIDLSVGCGKARTGGDDCIDWILFYHKYNG